MLSCLSHVTSSVTYFTRFLRRSPQNAPPVSCSRSHLHNIFLHRFSLLQYFPPVMHLCSKGSHSQRNHGHTSVRLKLWGDTGSNTHVSHSWESSSYPLVRKSYIKILSMFLRLFVLITKNVCLKRGNLYIDTVQSVGTRYMWILGT